MERIKGLLQNKKIQAAILIGLICILFIAVLISNRSGQQRGLWSYKEASNSDAQETKIITEEITREIDAQVETDTNGKIFSILVEDETIDLSSDEIETKAESDGSVTYKVGDKTQVVVNKDGTAKVIKTETVTKVVVTSNKNNQTGNQQTGNSQDETGRPSGNTSSTSPNRPVFPTSSNQPSSDESSSESGEQDSDSSSQIATDPSEESTTKPSSEEESSGDDIQQSDTDALPQSSDEK